MKKIEVIASTTESTVVAEYIPEQRKSTDYQTEADLEKDFIVRLQQQGYERLSIRSEQDLIDNLRLQLEKLNDIAFLDSEWEDFYQNIISNGNEGILQKTKKIQIDNLQTMILESGTSKNIRLIDKNDIHKNSVQVINQYRQVGEISSVRYDVTILVNGFPLVHIELKKRGNAIREAFNQINRYQRESFWDKCGLFEYVQLFVISNGTNTKYYSNTTRAQHIKDMLPNTKQKKPKTSHSFEFTSYWADANNRVISDLVDFTKTFFAKHTLLSILTRYCVFTSENLLLVMRPYQIAATERILNRIEISRNANKAGTKGAGGYVWHATGSGKTLTSFKTAQLAKDLPYIDKVIFVVDRKDLDYQTMKEYDRFEKGAANSNVSTKILKKQLEDNSLKIIITTIQKLAVFIDNNEKHDIYQKRIVMIFDECHRSQFGAMHKAITKHFKQYYIFGFTGTPIFAANSAVGLSAGLGTTPQIFGGLPNAKGEEVSALHTYTIVDAIRDQNVLHFKVGYFNTVQKQIDAQDKQVKAIDIETALLDPRRVNSVVGYILDHFDQKTYRNQNNSQYAHKIITNVNEMASSRNNTVIEQRRENTANGFNSIFAVGSIPAAMKYYDEVKKQLAERKKDLKIAIIFSASPNKEEPDGILDEENFETQGLGLAESSFLETAIADYNEQFNVNYGISSELFSNYYKDVSLRMKNREIDMLIVVNMFLTGFDATTLNTLWVDKNLRQHGLIQAFSRTNRILNSIKAFGNIVCFRNLEKQTNEALALFGDKNAGGIVLLKTYDEYINGYEENGKYIAGYKELINELKRTYPLDKTIVGEDAENCFIRLFGRILQLKNILTSFDEFENLTLDTPLDFQDYQSKYIDMYQNYAKKSDAEKERINEDIVFEMELIKQIEVNIDYILTLVAKFHQSNCENESIKLEIDKAINAGIELRSKRELIKQFIKEMTVKTDMDKDWLTFARKQKEEELTKIIADNNLKATETRAFMTNAFRDGEMKTEGTGIDSILPPISRFRADANRVQTKQVVIQRLSSFYEKYTGVV